MRFGGIVLGVVLTLAACSSDPAPKEPKPSATPTVTAPTMPAQAKENTDEGAAAFVDHYVKISNYAAQTGDVEELSRLSDPKCEGCQSYIKLYRDTYKAGGYFKGGDWSPGEMHLELGEPETLVSTTVTWPSSRFRTSSDEPESAAVADSSLLTYGLVRSSDAWQVSQLVREGAK